MSTFKPTEYECVFERTMDQQQQQLPVTANYKFGFTNNTELVWDPMPIKAFGRIMRTTNQELSLLIKEYYGKTFHDLRGTFIQWDGQQMILTIYFSKNMEPLPEGKIGNLVDISVSPDGRPTYYAMKQALQNKAMGKRYSLNDETKLLLSDICYGGRTQAKPSNLKFWNQAISEMWLPTGDPFYGPRVGQLLLCVRGCFDFHRVLSKLYGRRMVIETTKSQEGAETIETNCYSNAAYEARYIKPVPNNPNVFVMHIEQFDKAAVERITVEENPVRPLAANGIVCF